MNYTSVELSRRIDGAGIKGPSEFAWYERLDYYGKSQGSYYLRGDGPQHMFDIRKDKPLFPAYTASELWAMLPKEIDGYDLEVSAYKELTVAGYTKVSNNSHSILGGSYSDGLTLVAALGELLLWCDANGHLEVSK